MKITLICISIVFALILLVFLLGPIVKRFYEYKYHKKVTAKVLYKYAKDYDVYLLNNVSLPINDKSIVFDHILFGEKFIYCIKDASYKNGIEGSAEDLKWFDYNKKGEMNYIENPFQENNLNISMLTNYMNLKSNDDFFYSVIAINNSCSYKIDKCNKREIVACNHDLYKIIAKTEKNAEVRAFNESRLEEAVKILYERIADK